MRAEWTATGWASRWWPPSITSLSISTGAVGAAVTVTGANFGATQGSGSVSFNENSDKRRTLAQLWCNRGMCLQRK